MATPGAGPEAPRAAAAGAGERLLFGRALEAKKLLAPATEEEKRLLRGSIARKATAEEVDAWVAASTAHLSDKARAAFYGMNAEQQYRVMYYGPLTESKDSTEVLYARIQDFLNMESQLKKLANSDPGSREKKPKEKKISELAMAVGRALVSTAPPKEVPEDERRFAPPAGVVEEPPKPAGPLMGKTKGVGGVVEALQKKYSMQKGERAKVVAETKELWKLEDDRNVPKTHCNQGWKWVIQGAEEAAKRGAEEKDRRKKEVEERTRKIAGERAKAEERVGKMRTERSRSSGSSTDRKRKAKSRKKIKAKGKRNKGRGRSGSVRSSGKSSSDTASSTSSDAAPGSPCRGRGKAGARKGKEKGRDKETRRVKDHDKKHQRRQKDRKRNSCADAVADGFSSGPERSGVSGKQGKVRCASPTRRRLRK